MSERWEVWKDECGCCWSASPIGGCTGLADDGCREWLTWRAAFDYADRMARADR